MEQGKRLSLDRVYSVFVIDPPYPQTKGGKRKVRPKQGKSLSYRTMSLDEIFLLLDKEIFSKADNPHTVFLWCIDKFLHETEAYMSWRHYRLHARLIWDKTNGIAPAFTVRYSHEYLLWYYKPKFMPINEDFRGKYTTVFVEDAREHSRKPDVAYEMINNLYPDLPKVDVFSRERRVGFDQFGDQCNFFD